MARSVATKKSKLPPSTSKKSKAKSAPKPKSKPIQKAVKAKPKKIVKASKSVKAVKVTKTKPAKVAKKPAPKVVKLIPSKAPKEPKAPKAPKVKKASAGPKGYTPSEYQKFKQHKEKFSDLSNQALKDLLKKNLQSMTGNKDDLIYKCADGATLGQIPRCPNCFGGRPKFDYQKGTYYCSGYRDDEDFKNCHSTFQLNEITRLPWSA